MTRPRGARRDSAHFPGAALRALLVAAVATAPSLLAEPAPGAAGPELSFLVGAAAGLIVLFEYAARTPALVDFRFAPPLNRMRFGVFCLALAAATAAVAWPAAEALGATLARAMTGALSPVDLAAWAVTRGSAPGPDPALRAAGALALTLAVAGLAASAAWIWFGPWPGDPERFNRWMNLPTFEPAEEADAPARLARHGRLAALTGLALPVALTGLGAAATRLFAADLFAAPLAQIWAAAIWAGLPACVLLRAVALLKLARMARREER
jgi:hypothetical protein